jgi:hypothetical protein
MTTPGAGPDIYSEAEGSDDTLSNLGPLRALAGVFEGRRGTDVHPVTGGDEAESYLERYELQPIDRQTNGPQLLYGLRYHQHITKPGERETFHDQVGYWLWEPATETVSVLLAIPRAEVAMAAGHVSADATSFTVTAGLGSATNGIASGPFLDEHFRTVSWTVTVTVLDADTWRYQQDTVLEVAGREGLVHHTDESTLVRIAPPSPNPLAAP